MTVSLKIKHGQMPPYVGANPTLSHPLQGKLSRKQKETQTATKGE